MNTKWEIGLTNSKTIGILITMFLRPWIATVVYSSIAWPWPVPGVSYWEWFGIFLIFGQAGKLSGYTLERAGVKAR